MYFMGSPVSIRNDQLTDYSRLEELKIDNQYSRTEHLAREPVPSATYRRSIVSGGFE